MNEWIGPAAVIAMFALLIACAAIVAVVKIGKRLTNAFEACASTLADEQLAMRRGSAVFELGLRETVHSLRNRLLDHEMRIDDHDRHLGIVRQPPDVTAVHPTLPAADPVDP